MTSETTTEALSPERLAEIREREQAATRGPWNVTEDRELLTRWVSSEDGALDIGFGYVGNRTQDDAAFVAAARTDVPALLAEIDRLTALLEFEREDIATWRDKAKRRGAAIKKLNARVAELERPEIERKRAEVRQSFMELAAQAREDCDHEGASSVECELREREAQWVAEDKAAGR